MSARIWSQSKDYDRILNKKLKTARYYVWHDFPKAAHMYYVSILRDAATFRGILPNLPDSEAIRQARKQVGEDEPSATPAEKPLN